MALYAQIFPRIAQINTLLLAALDRRSLDALDRMLVQLTARAQRLDEQLASDVRANRRRGGTRRVRPL